MLNEEGVASDLQLDLVIADLLNFFRKNEKQCSFGLSASKCSLCALIALFFCCCFFFDFLILCFFTSQ